ncbi:MAG: hypothetical protein AAF399_00125 [Bacteroidota bacterium]
MSLNHFRQVICLSTLMLLSSLLFAQVNQGNIFYESTGEGQVLVCAWKSIPLLDDPGLGARQIGNVVFAEEVQHLGEEALVKSERRNYVWVQSAEGRQGWVDEHYLVEDGGVVVCLKETKAYERPGTYTSSLGESFREGEIVILTDFQDNWVKVTSYQKELSGWVEGYNNVSVDKDDILAATNLAQALVINDATLRRQEIEKITTSRGNLTPEMMALLRRQANALGSTASTNANPAQPAEVYYDQYYTPGGEDAYSPYRPGSSTRPTTPSRSEPTPTPQTGATRAGIVEKEVIDMTTGRTYIQVLETGSVQPVKNKKASDIYYCYHKNIPVGSTVLLEIPGNRGYVPLKVIAPLRKDNPNMIGLGGELIKTIFGVEQAKDLGKVTIAYPKS